VRRLGDPHEMRRDFRVEMGRHLDAGRRCDGNRTQPAELPPPLPRSLQLWLCLQRSSR
jgi:hypothetical protein